MGKKQLESTEVETLVERSTEDDESTNKDLQSVEGATMIDGRPIEMSSTGRSEVDFAPVRLWDKVCRADLPADIRQTFV